jgi:hypothetical protein
MRNVMKAVKPAKNMETKIITIVILAMIIIFLNLMWILLKIVS